MATGVKRGMDVSSAPSTDDAMTTPPLKLIYLDHHYWRAEAPRVALFMANVPYEDARMDYEGMYSSGALTFGTFPALVVGGKGTLNQTQAIAVAPPSRGPGAPTLAATAPSPLNNVQQCGRRALRRVHLDFI